MSVEIKVPSSGESVSEVAIGGWLKSEGDRVERDEALVVLETDKASMELPAPEDGTLSEIRKRADETVEIGEVIGLIEVAADAGERGERDPAEEDGSGEERDDEPSGEGEEAGDRPSGDDREAPATADQGDVRSESEAGPGAAAEEDSSDRSQASERPDRTEEERTRERDGARRPEAERGAERGAREEPTLDEEEIVPMSLLRRGIAKRLVQVQNEAALLTTFNEIDTSALAALRRRWGDAFESRHGAPLGIMSLFVKATIEALKQVPELNAEVRGTDMVYHRRYHVGIAVGGERGLVVPVLRDADRMSLAEIERAIDDLASRAEQDALELAELQGGTFTITNGGVFGSLLSTPIVNPPQSGVLGMHAIQERPVARDGGVEVRPMMYVALTYDHRVVDGREAVGFLRRVKEIVESPERLLLEA